MARVTEPVWAPIVRLRRTSANTDAGALEPGRDLVLDLARSQGYELPLGVLLDDWLSIEARDEIDREAFGRLAAWRARHEKHLTVDGVNLAHVWETELLAEVFMPETTIFGGLLASIGTRGPDRFELEAIDAERTACLRALLEPLGVEVATPSSYPLPPHYPSEVASPRVQLSRRLLRPIIHRIGVPQRVRGEVYLFPYWHLRALFERLTADGFGVVLEPGALPPSTLDTLTRSALRGGWVGQSRAADRRRSRRDLAAALAVARAHPQELDPFERLLDVRALRMLEQRAGETLAVVRRMRKAFARPRLKLAILPYDCMPDSRAIIQAARDEGVPTLVVQHGFFAEPNDPDKTLADVAAVWTERDARSLAKRRPGRIEVTGNPGLMHLTGLVGRRQNETVGHTIVLVDYASRQSAWVDRRVSFTHVDAALSALAAARPGTVVTIRPHPAEHEPEIFAAFAEQYREIDVRIDASSPIAALIGQADLCVAAISTATLEFAAAGVPVILLNVSARPGPWPLDGQSVVPFASSAAQVAELIPRVLASEGVPGRDLMVEALGAREDALDNMVALIRSLLSAQ